MHPTDERLWSIMAALRRGADLLDALAQHRRRSVVPAQAHEHREHGEAPAVRVAHAGPAARRQAHVASPTSRSRTLARPPARAGARAPRGVGHPARLQDGRHLRRRVRRGDAVLLLAPTSRRTRRSPRPARRRSSSAAGRSASARASSSTTARVHAAWALERRRLSRRSWSTPTRRPSPPTSTRATASTSSRSTKSRPRHHRQRSRRRRRRRRRPTAGHRPVRRPDRDQPRRAAAQRRRCPIIGSSHETIDLAEDRRRFEEFLSGIGIPQPPGAAVTNVEDAIRTADRLGYPVLVRPELRARRPRDGDRPEPDRTRPLRRARPPKSPTASRSSSTSTSKARKSKSTPSATASASSSPASWSTSSAPASTPATRWPSTRGIHLTPDEVRHHRRLHDAHRPRPSTRAG